MHCVDIEGLETRALLATLPAPTTTGDLQNLSTMMGNAGGSTASMSSTQVAVDPLDPNKLVAVWVDNDPTMYADTDSLIETAVEAAYSVNGGQSWLPLFSEPTNVAGLPSAPFLLNPTTSGPTLPYGYVIDPSLGFDDGGNFYIQSEYLDASTVSGASSGAVTLQKYTFTNSVPSSVAFTSNQQTPSPYPGASADLKVIYQWYASTDDKALDPTMTVDDNQATLPAGVTSQTDAYSGNVYVSWSTIDQPTYEDPLGGAFNPNRILTYVSSDGGNNFSPDTVASVNSSNANDVNYSQGDDNGPTSERDFTPTVTVSQGRLASESGQAGDPGITGGQVTVAWDDAGSNTVMANTLSPGRDDSFGQSFGDVPVAVPIATADTTDFVIPVDITNTKDLDTLDVTVNIVDNDQKLELILIAPSGQQFPLVEAVTGTNFGVTTYSDNNIPFYLMGTTFDDNATRSIYDLSDTSPFVGDYTPQGSGFGFGGGAATLDQFLADQLSTPQSVNGTWTLETVDLNTPTTTTPTGFVYNWSLSFGRGMTADNDVAVPGSAGLAVPLATATGLPTTTAPASAVGIGPGLAMTSDNTLGTDSPYEGRIYLAFVGYINQGGNPTTNTDIFLTYSDDGGRSWSTPTEVNDDSSDSDGSTQSNETNPNDSVTGRTQFDPSVAVDPTTGTLVVSWLDARNDPNDTLITDYLTTSIDGGNTFGAESYANPEETAVDAITGETDVLGPNADDGTASYAAANGLLGYGTIGLAVYGGQVYPLWVGNQAGPTVANGGTTGNALAADFRPMAIAAGPRVVSSAMGPIPLAEAASGDVTFTVTFDRPINPTDESASFTAKDVQVFYHDTDVVSSTDPYIPLEVLSVTPVISTGVGPDDKFGYTTFTVAFDPNFQPSGGSSNIGDYTGTYSYLITPDDEAGNPIVSPIDSYVSAEVSQPLIGPVQSTEVPLPIPSSGTGGSGSSDDITTSTINIAGYNNQIITGITLDLTLSVLNADGLVVTLTAPDGQSETIALTSDTLSDAPFLLKGLNGGAVDGTYTLTIDDTVKYNTGQLTAWSIAINSELPSVQFQPGAPMDQNANGVTDENPLTMAGGYTGLTPGDVYADPAPQLTAPVTFTSAAYTGGVNTGGYILSPPFNQDTLPLIVPGPQILSTQVVGTTTGTTESGSSEPYGTSDLLTDDTTSEMDVTFDRPIVVNTQPAGDTPTAGSFNAGQVVSIMGPTGPITGPQAFSDPSVDQTIPAATSTAPGVLDSTVTVSSGGTLKIQDITVSLSIGSTSDSALTAVLIAPDGTQIPLFAGVGGSSGQDFLNTVFSDSAEESIAQGTAPFTGTFRPGYNLSSATLTSLESLASADGTWTLQVTNTSTGAAATLDTWSLNITPVIAVTPVAATETTVNGVKMATEFAVGFPRQEVSGTYTIQLGADIQDQFGDAMDVSQSAGLDALRDVSQDGPTTTVQYTATDLPKTIAPSTAVNQDDQPVPSSVSSTIDVPDDFVIEGDKTAAGQSVMQVQLDLTDADDPGLTATLSHYGPGGTPMGTVTLFGGVGSGTNTANFDNTVFDDNAPTPVQLGSAPFSAIYDPQQSLATVFAPTTGGQQGMSVQGTWVLTITNSATSGTAGSLKGWSLTFQKPLPTDGMGQPGSDDPTIGFEISTLAQDDALSSEAWSPVGAASSTDEAGEVTAIAVDPSDATGNTVYAGGASGGIWKTTDFLTTSPSGPTWTPLTNFGPEAAANISSIAIFPRNDDPSDSIIIAGTGGADSGEQAAAAPGVGFLISLDGGATWNVYDSTVNVSGTYTDVTGSGILLPIDGAGPGGRVRDRDFVGTTINQIAVDPQLSPTGQVIIYAAVSGPNGMGGIWESQNTGQTWEQVLNAGDATSVILDQDSGIALDPATDTDVAGNDQIVYAGIYGGGVYMSSNQGQDWTLMNGGVGNPLTVNLSTGLDVNPAQPSPSNPNDDPGKIALSVPASTGNAVEDAIYEGWLYAAVATQSGGFYGLYVTKDFGENWTQVQLPTLTPLGPSSQAIYNQAVASDTDSGNSQYAITDDTQGNVNLTLSTDPTDPNILYLGGFGGDGYNSDTGLIRINITDLSDAHALVPYGQTDLDPSEGPPVWDQLAGPPVTLTTNVPTTPIVPDSTPFLNFIRSPEQPFYDEDSTLYVNGYSSFVNSGLGATWTPMDVPTTGEFIPAGSNTEISGTGYNVSLTVVDPTTGLTRLIVGNDDGIYSALDDNGTFETSIGSSDATPAVNRNGDLQLAQIYYGAVEPSSDAAQAAGALFYAGAENIGGQGSDPNLLTDGDLVWSALQAGGTVLNASGTAVDEQGSGTLFQFWSADQGGESTNFVKVNGVGRTFGLLQESNGHSYYVPQTLLADGSTVSTTDPQWPVTEVANLVVDPVNDDDMLVSSTTGNVFETTDQGVTWFQIGSGTSNFGSPGTTDLALAFGAPDPSAPEGVGNLGNFIYVGTSTGAVYVSQNAGGSWTEISTGLDGSAIQDIITDPARGSHDAYAVTDDGVYYLPDSITSTSNPTPTWENITGGLKSLAYSIFGQSYNPTTDPAASQYDLATVLNSIAANWDYAIPNSSGTGTHPVLYVAANSGVYMSTDNGTTWTLFPDDTYGAEVEGGDLPHVDVTDLSLSQGNVAVATGMPALAGPYQTILFTGTLASGSTTVTGVSDLSELAVGDDVNGTGIPSGTTIASIDSAAGSITLSADATASGSQSLGAADPTATPDPDLLMASTYGEGAFAINLAPMLLSGTVAINSNSSSGTTTVTTASGSETVPEVTTATPTIDGLSEITGFGNATWISIYDETPGDSTYGQVIGGFDPQTYALGQSILPTSSNSTGSLGNFAIPLSTGFSTNGLKTIEVYATDDAGSRSVPVTLTFELNATNLSHSAPTTRPSAPTLSISPSIAIISGYPTTNSTDPEFLGTADPGTYITVTETWDNPPTGTTDTTTTFNVTTNSDGSFSFPFQDFDDSSGNPVLNGQFTVTATATYTDYTNLGASGSSTPVVFVIDNTAPAPVTNLHLDPGTDTGIVGDDVTSDRLPEFVGTTAAGDQVELFVDAPGESGIVQSVVIAGSGTSDNFSIQLPFALTNGEASVYVEVVDPAGNVSGESNTVTVAITSTNADYIPSTTVDPTGGSTSDPSLFVRNTTTGQLEWLVQTPSGTTPWFGPASTLYASPTGTAEVVPFQGDFDGDGLSDLAYYNLSTATWTIDESSNYAVQGATSFVLGTPNSSLPVAGYFSPNGGQLNQQPQPAQTAEAAVMTYANGQDIFTIASSTLGNYNVTFPIAGQAGDIPIAGDFDGVGYDQLAIYRPSTEEFFVLQQNYSGTTGQVTYSVETFNLGQYLAQFSLSADASSLVPVPAQYNNTTPATPSTTPIFGKTEAAVYDPVKGVFLILGPGNTPYTVSGFQAGGIPAPADYLGDGSDLPAVYQPSTGQFIGDVDGTLTTLATVGQSGDIPVMAPLVYRLPAGSPNTDPSGGGGSGSTGTTTGGGGSTSIGTTGGTGGGSGTNNGVTPGGSTSGSSTTTTSSGSVVTTQSGQSATPPVSVAPTKKHKKVVKKTAHPKPVVHKKPAAHSTKKETKHDTKAAHSARTVQHKVVVKKTAKVAAHATTKADVVDLALEDVHVNLRRSNGRRDA